MKDKRPPRPVHWDRPTIPTRIVLQPRDLEILRVVFRHRFVRPEHVQVLLGAESLATIKRRMRQLWENRYLARPRAPRPTRVLTEEMIYSLAKAGAVLLERGAAKYGISGDPALRIAKLDWDETPDKQPGWLFVDHQLLVVEVMMSLELAATRSGLRLDWKGHHYRKEDILRFRDAEGIQHRIPDAHFSLVVPGRGGIHHYLEADRGHVSLKRMQERYELYFEWWKRRRREAANTRLPFVNFRVITVATDATHRDALRRVASHIGRDRDHSNAWRALLFAHSGDFDLEHPDRILEPIFSYADSEERVSLATPAQLQTGS